MHFKQTVAALQQTKLVKIWLNRQELTALDLAEQQQQLDEEAQVIAEMQEAFKEKESKENKPEEGIETPDTKEGERRPWQYVKIKIPTYQWEMEKGTTPPSLKPTYCRTTSKKSNKAGGTRTPTGSRAELDSTSLSTCGEKWETGGKSSSG